MDLGNWMNKILIGWGVDPKIANTFDEAIIAILMICIAVGLDYLCQGILVGGMRKYTKHSPHVWNTLLMKRRVFHNLIHTIPGILVYTTACCFCTRKRAVAHLSENMCRLHHPILIAGHQRSAADDIGCIFGKGKGKEPSDERIHTSAASHSLLRRRHRCNCHSYKQITGKPVCRFGGFGSRSDAGIQRFYLRICSRHTVICQ